MIFQLATPVQSRISAPIRMAMTLVSPTAPGMSPRNRFQALVPAADRPSSEAWDSGVAPESASTTSPPFQGVPPSRALLRPPTQTESPDILLG